MICLALGLCLEPAIGHAQETAECQAPISDVFKFDEWGDLSFAAEKLRLTNLAQEATAKPHSIIYLVIHAGQKACVDEAKNAAFVTKVIWSRWEFLKTE